jgi:transposase-like protein
METHRRGSDGRRRFTPEFKREQVARVQRGEVTMAELSRELAVSHSLVRKWKVLLEIQIDPAIAAGQIAHASRVSVVPGMVQPSEHTTRSGRSASHCMPSPILLY